MNQPTDPKQIVAQGYDDALDAYSNLDSNGSWPRMRWVEKLSALLKPADTILDLGCASGIPVAQTLSNSFTVTGVDISPNQIELATKNVPAATFLVGDADTVDFSPNSFNGIISLYTFEHIPRQNHAKLFRQIHSWLKSEGVFLISIEAGEVEGVVSEWLGVPMFFSCFDPDTIKAMIVDAGFEIAETAIEDQTENGDTIPYLWILAKKI